MNIRKSAGLDRCCISQLSLLILLLSLQLHHSLAFSPTIGRSSEIIQESNSPRRVPVKTILRRNWHIIRKSCTSSSSLNMLETLPFQAIGEAYSNALIEQPILAKGSTGFILCGVGDIIAQMKGNKGSKETDNIERLSGLDFARLGRFATKGFFGTLIWSVWYDYSAMYLFKDEDVIRILAKIGVQEAGDILINTSRTILFLLTEQFVTCPIVYGLWEIPVATLLNGGSISSIPMEEKDKLGDMLIENAKIWTPFNIVIYNAPVQFRTVLGNVCDIIWQSVVADFAADCGGEKVDDSFIDEELVVVMRDDGVDDGFDYIGKDQKIRELVIE